MRLVFRESRDLVINYNRGFLWQNRVENRVENREPVLRKLSDKRGFSILAGLDLASG